MKIRQLFFPGEGDPEFRRVWRGAIITALVSTIPVAILSARFQWLIAIPIFGCLAVLAFLPTPQPTGSRLDSEDTEGQRADTNASQPVAEPREADTKTRDAGAEVRQTDPAVRPAQTAWVPNADVAVVEGVLVIEIELAGLQKDDLEISIDGNRLIVSGLRRQRLDRKASFLVNEVDSGPFECVIEIPPSHDVHGSETKASYQNGFLTIKVQQPLPPNQAPHPSGTPRVETRNRVRQLLVSQS